MKLLKNFFNHLIDTKLDWKHQRKTVILSLGSFIVLQMS